MVNDALKPFAYRAYRGVWLSVLVLHITNWTQQVGAASLMTSLTPSPAMAALVQSAATLPGLVFGLLGGALADLLDRRPWLIMTLAGILVVSLACAGTVASGLVSPLGLLVFTAMLGVVYSLQMPAAQAMTGESVPRELLRAGMALGGVAFNISRITGPAIAGALVAWGGGTAVYLAVAVCSVGIMVYLYATRSREVPHTKAPPERLWSALRTGVRFVRHSPESRQQMSVALVSVLTASAPWALMPVVARDAYHMGSGGYGLLLGAMGVGGIVGVWVMSAMLRRWPFPPTVVALSVAVFGGVTVLMAAEVPLWAMLAALVVGGSMWMTFLTTIWGEFQSVLPDWVRARAISIYNMVYMLAMGVGAAVWGYVAAQTSTSTALYASSACMALAALWARRKPAVTPLQHGEPVPAFGEAATVQSMFGEMGLEDEPVLVQQSYRVRPEAAEDFLRAAALVGRARQRNGALFWRVYRDLQEPDLYVARYMVDSWAELQRQSLRETPEDRELSQSLQRHLQPGTEPQVRHLAGLSLPPV